MLLNPLLTLIPFCDTVASSPRAVTDRLLGCLGNGTEIDTNYTIKSPLSAS